VLRNQSENSRS